MKRIGFVILLVLSTISMAADTIAVVSGSNAVFNAISKAQADNVLLGADECNDETFQ